MVNVTGLVDTVREGIHASLRGAEPSLGPLLEALSSLKATYQSSDCNGLPAEFIRTKAIDVSSHGLINFSQVVSPEVVKGDYFFINLNGARLADEAKARLVLCVLLFFDVPTKPYNGNNYAVVEQGHWVGINTQ